MTNDDVWLRALRQQVRTIENAKLDLEESRRTNWRVLQAELEVASVERAYHRLLTDAPRSAAVRHLRERVENVRA